jgi:hypothetical protein
MNDLTDVLYPIELAVLREWGREPSLIDIDVEDVFASLGRRYLLESRGQVTKVPSLSPKAERLYAAVLIIAEAQIGRRPVPPEELNASFRTNVSAAELASCFKRLSKSVATWSERGGRQGYLDYIDKFVPQ